MRKGFWAILEEMAPSLPEKGKGYLEWIAGLDAIQEYLKSCGFDYSDEIIKQALNSADEWNPGFPWRVDLRKDGRFHFTRR